MRKINGQVNPVKLRRSMFSKLLRLGLFGGAMLAGPAAMGQLQQNAQGPSGGSSGQTQGQTPLLQNQALQQQAFQQQQQQQQQQFARVNQQTLPSTSAPNSLPQIGAVDPANQITVKTYPVPSQLVGTISAQLQLQYHNVSGVTITTDPRTEQLMIVAPVSVQQQISGNLERLIEQNRIPLGDQGVGAASHYEKSYVLRNLTWRELESALSKLAGSKLEVTTENNGDQALLKIPNQLGLRDLLRVDRTSNQVTIMGTGPSVSAWMQVIHSLDAGQADSQVTTHVVPLAPAHPRSVRRMVQLVSARLPQQQDKLPEEDPNAPATVVVDKLGETSDSGLLGDVQIEVVDSVGLIIIRGSKRDVERTLKVIEQIKEQAKTTEPMVDILQLKHSNSDAVATLVNQLYETVYLPRQGSVSITALIQPNAILLIGRPEVVKSVKDLIDKIDKPLEPTDELKVIRLEHASAVDLETRIRDFFEGTGAAAAQGGNPQGGTQNRGLATRVKIASDYRTNSLIVQASPREMVEVHKVVKDLDVESGETENRVQVFPLKHAVAQELQQVITQILTGQAATTGGGGQQGQFQQGQVGQGGANAGRSNASVPSGKLSLQDRQTGEKVESGILAGVVVSSDPSVNALVVRAPAASMPLIAALVDQLDVLPSAEARIKFFELKNSDATTVALTLQNLFGLSPSAGLGSQFQLQNTFAQNIARGLTAGGDSTLVQLRITAEARSNSVIISGSEADLEVIEALILRLDEDQRDSRRSEVIWLRNGSAPLVATALQSYFQSYLQTQSQLVQTQVISPQELVNRQVFVVAEQTTNSVLISASPALFDVALSLIERLDRRPPMVTVQALIAEVQLDDSLELGAEFGLQDSLLFSRANSSRGTLASPVFNNLTGGTSGNNLAGQGLSTFGVGRGSAAGVGGMVLAASSESVGMLVRALQTAGRLQVLNRPTLTTLENREATSRVGGLVPRVTSVGQASVGIPQTIQTTDIEVGLLLQILPRVSPDGLIIMEVGIENSNVGDPDQGIPIGFGPGGEPIRSPIINSTQAQTVVSAYSGQTVVFAGLISKTRSTSRSQVPFLGSLPLIGAAFRFDTEKEQRKELMVILTPRIIQTDEDYENLKQIESSRMSWCLADVVNLHGDVGLSGGNGLWGPARGGMMYPDRPAIKVPDRAPVDLNNNYPMYGSEVPGVVIPVPEDTSTGVYEDLNVSNQRSVRAQQASFRSTQPQQNDPKLVPLNGTPNNQPASGAGVQKGSY